MTNGKVIKINKKEDVQKIEDDLKGIIEKYNLIHSSFCASTSDGDGIISIIAIGEEKTPQNTMMSIFVLKSLFRVCKELTKQILIFNDKEDDEGREG